MIDAKRTGAIEEATRQQPTAAAPAAYAERRRVRPRDPGIGDWIAAHLEDDESEGTSAG